MESYFGKAKKIASTTGFRETIKIIGIFLIALLAFVGFSGIGLHFYFERNQKEIVEKINQQINENIQGEAKIGDIGYKFLVGFPNFTVVLSDVQLEDSLIAIHKRPLLKAKEIEVRLNVLSFLKNEVNVHKIVIIDATIDLFKDKNGISNSNIFKPKDRKSVV